MKPSSAKQKGRSYQQWVRDKILEHFPALEPDDVKSTSMGAGGEDVQLSPAARKLFPYTIECKSYEKIAVYKWYEQAKTHKGYEPLVFMKGNRKQPLVLMNAEYFIKLIGELKC
jgi:hypothetical protein